MLKNSGHKTNLPDAGSQDRMTLYPLAKARLSTRSLLSWVFFERAAQSGAIAFLSYAAANGTAAHPHKVVSATRERKHLFIFMRAPPTILRKHNIVRNWTLLCASWSDARRDK